MIISRNSLRSIPLTFPLPPSPIHSRHSSLWQVIGHEITHGFDDQGRQYDGTGSLVPWWSQETIEGFTAKAQCFINQYNNYTVPELIPILGEEDAHLNGKRTLGENIADNGGIREAVRAYIRSVESQGPEPRLPGLKEFSPEQMFFIFEAQVPKCTFIMSSMSSPGGLWAADSGRPPGPGENSPRIKLERV